MKVGSYPSIDLETTGIYYHSGFLICDIDGDGYMRYPDFLKHTIAFMSADTDEGKQNIGTAFFVFIQENGLQVAYLVTNKHVVDIFIKNDINMYCRLNRSDINDVHYSLLPKDGWMYHPNPTVDLAVLRWKPTGQPIFFAVMDFRDISLTKERLEKINHRLGEGDEVVFSGLFTQYSGYERNIPVVRKGHIALLTDELIDFEYGPTNLHLIEGQVYPGNSGGPCFVTLIWNNRPTLFLLGVVAGWYPDNQVVVTKVGKLELYTHFGISAVVPVEKLNDILYGEEAMKDREQIIKTKMKEDSPKPASNYQEDYTRTDFMTDLKKVTNR